MRTPKKGGSSRDILFGYPFILHSNFRGGQQIVDDENGYIFILCGQIFPISLNSMRMGINMIDISPDFQLKALPVSIVTTSCPSADFFRLFSH